MTWSHTTFFGLCVTSNYAACSRISFQEKRYVTYPVGGLERVWILGMGLGETRLACLSFHFSGVEWTTLKMVFSLRKRINVCRKSLKTGNNHRKTETRPEKSHDYGLTKSFSKTSFQNVFPWSHDNDGHFQIVLGALSKRGSVFVTEFWGR